MGQAKNKGRNCPVVGRAITSAECGESRISWRACPAECPHNPWSPRTYDQALAIEQVVYDKLNQRLIREQGGQTVAKLFGSTPETQANFTSAYFFERDVEGLTFLQRWERKNWIDLNNDHRVFLKALSLQKTALIEVLEVRNGEETLVRDRLNLARPPFVIYDRKLAAMAGRFTTLLCYLVEMPHYTRLNGAALPLPLLNGLEGEDLIRAIVEHQAAPADGDDLRHWLMKKFGLVADIFEAISAAIQDALFQNAVYTKVWYRIVGNPGDLIAALQRCPDVISMPVNDELKEGMTHEWAWKATPDNTTPGTIPVLGKVLCGASTVRIQAAGVKSFAALREAFERVAGGTVQFERQRKDDMGVQLRNRSAIKSDPSLVPPSLLKHLPSAEIAFSLVSTGQGETPADIEAKLSLTNARWCDQSIPALGGKTPREAAADPSLRHLLVNMVKHRISQADRAGLDGDRFSDESWIVKELGLSELDYPLPPALQDKMNNPAPDEEEEDLEDEFEEEDLRPLSPCLPPCPLNFDDIAQRIRHVYGYYPEPTDMLDAFEVDAPDLYDWILAGSKDGISEEEAIFLEYLAGTLWYTVYPPEYAPRAFDFDRFESAFPKLLLELKTSIPDPSAERSPFDSVFQPELCRVFREMVQGASEDGIEDKCLSPRAAFWGLLLCKLLTDELALGAQF